MPWHTLQAMRLHVKSGHVGHELQPFFIECLKHIFGQHSHFVGSWETDSNSKSASVNRVVDPVPTILDDLGNILDIFRLSPVAKYTPKWELG